MNLKEILGDAWKDDMTAADIAEALKELPGPAEYDRQKKALDKATHEAAENKRALREKQTAEEADAADRKKQLDDMQAELETLRTEKKVAGFKAKFLALGFSEDAAGKAAQAQVDGDTDEVFAALQARQQEVEKAAKKQSVMGSDRRPAAGSGTVTQDYQKRIDAALASGNRADAAYYTRLQFEQAHQE